MSFKSAVFCQKHAFFLGMPCRRAPIEGPRPNPFRFWGIHDQYLHSEGSDSNFLRIFLSGWSRDISKNRETKNQALYISWDFANAIFLIQKYLNQPQSQNLLFQSLNSTRSWSSTKNCSKKVWGTTAVACNFKVLLCLKSHWFQRAPSSFRWPFWRTI